MSTELWALHIEGPDDILAAPSKEAAEERARQLNEIWAKAEAAQPSENWPVMNAVVVPWTGSAENHARDLADWDKP